MESTMTKVSHIDPMLEDMKVLVRCISLWKSHPAGKPNEVWSLDAVLQDPEGHRIHAKIKKDDMNKFQALLEEGKCYIIGNFGVAKNNANYPILNHPFRIIFFKSTTVTRVAEFDRNTLGFKFTPFPSFTSRKYPETELVDVIGTLISISDSIPFNKSGEEKTRRSLMLEDVDGVTLEFCFFDEWNEKFAKLYETRESVGHVVIILQLCKVTYFNKKPSLMNAIYPTKLYINADIPEVAAFKQRYVQKDGYDPKKHTISQITPVKKVVTSDEFFKGATKKTVAGIRDSETEYDCILYAKIHKIHKECGWTYLACRKCGRVAKEVDVSESSTSGNKGKKQKIWNCVKHNNLTGGAVGMRYKVTIRVTDDTGSAALLLFDDNVFKLCGEQCYDVLKKNGQEHDDYFPAELDKLKGKQLLFRFKYKDEHIKNKKDVYQIMWVSEDEDMISFFKKDFIKLVDDTEYEVETPLLNNAKKSILLDSVPFNIEETPKSGKGSSKTNGTDDDDNMSNAIESAERNGSKEDTENSSASAKRPIIIDLDDYNEDESESKRMKQVVRVKIEPKD